MKYIHQNYNFNFISRTLGNLEITWQWKIDNNKLFSSENVLAFSNPFSENWPHKSTAKQYFQKFISGNLISQSHDKMKKKIQIGFEQKSDF